MESDKLIEKIYNQVIENEMRNGAKKGWLLKEGNNLIIDGMLDEFHLLILDWLEKNNQLPFPVRK